MGDISNIGSKGFVVPSTNCCGSIHAAMSLKRGSCERRRVHDPPAPAAIFSHSIDTAATGNNITCNEQMRHLIAGRGSRNAGIG